jgi:signal transduction histidine kinase/CheY-like chemotaxis protein
MNSQEALIQIEALEEALAEEQIRREALELELQDLHARNAEAQAEIQAFKSDIWAIDEVQQALEAVSRTGSEFVIHMDHRLRTTLNGILGMVELLLNCDLSEEEHEYAEGASSSGRDLLNMLNDILDYCRMDAGHIEVREDVVETEDFIKGLCAPFESTGAQSGTKLEVALAPSVPKMLHVDSEHLRRALTHLVENALRYAPGGTVRIETDVQGKGDEAEMLIAVRDTGSGIAPDDLARVCEAFERISNDDHEGVGLGLTIVRRLAELLGGRFELTSELGEGSVATLHLPLAAVTGEAALSAPESDSVADTARARVLIVEDNDVNQKVAMGFLKMVGCEAETAENGLEGIERLAGAHFDLVLMDCMMPEVDGYEATRRIRSGAAGESQASVPIIALTADDSAGARQNCLRSGMDDYMAKPVRIDRLRSMLRIWLPPNLRPPAE